MQQEDKVTNPSSEDLPNNLRNYLKQLVTAACRHPTGSRERQKYLTQIIRIVEKHLWRENTPYYQDALQQTWLFFCRNICDSGSAAQYDPERSTVITWLDTYLRRRLQDCYINEREHNHSQMSGYQRQGRSGEMQEVHPLDCVEASPDIPPILETVRAWATNDRKGQLRQLHIKGYPQVTCQLLILRRLPPECSWKELSEEFGISIPTLSSFYQRQCLPRLRNFGETEGYL